MKKVFTFIFCFLAMTMVSKAQILLSEGFEGGAIPSTWTTIDSDGDGNNWDTFEVETAHGGSQVVTSASYINYFGALTPDNWLISPAVTINATANLSFWVKGQDANYAEENYSVYVATSNTVAAFTATTPVISTVSTATWEQKIVDLSSYVGQTIYIAFRHHNVTDMFRLNLDDIEIFAQPTTATIAATPNVVNFPTTIAGTTSSPMQVNVMGYVLTTGINATTTAPFEVSADGINYDTVATLGTTGGTMYVRYAPTAAGTNSGFITLSSTGAADDTINLSGNAIECVAENSLPYVEDFQGGVFPPYCWQLISTTADTWTTYTTADDNIWASCEGSDSETQNEQLITKTFDFSSYSHALQMGFNFMSNYTYVVDSNVVDLVIYASTDGGTTFDTTPIWKLSESGIHFANWTPTLATINISSLIGQSNVAFKIALEGSVCQILFDSLYIQDINDPTIFVVAEDSYNMYVEVGTTKTIQFNVDTYNLTTAVVATTAAPFEVSADGITFGNTATLPIDGGVVYVRYTGTTGVQTGSVSIASTGANTITVALVGEGYTCGGFPIEEDLNHGGNFPGCWTVLDTEENPIIMALAADSEDNYALRFNSYDIASSYDQYLISPEITYANGEMMFSFDYLPYNSGETFSVGYSTTTNDITAFTWINNMTANDNTDWSTYCDAVPQGAKYVAIQYNSEWAYFLYIDNLKIEESNGVADHTQSAVNVYPNPAADYVNVTAGASIHSVEIFSLAGKKIAAYDANDMMATINTSSLANGMYMIRINTENGVVTNKFTVAR